MRCDKVVINNEQKIDLLICCKARHFCSAPEYYLVTEGILFAMNKESEGTLKTLAKSKDGKIVITSDFD